MSATHFRSPLLFALASRLPAGDPAEVDGWVYRRDIGAWVDADNRELLMVLAADPPPKPPPKPVPPPTRPKPRPMSKKFDHETGEDMKGE